MSTNRNVSGHYVLYSLAESVQLYPIGVDEGTDSCTPVCSGHTRVSGVGSGRELWVYNVLL